MKVCILIVDDEILQLNLISSVIHDLRPNYQIFSTHLPQEALDILRREPINALMTDVKMPGMSGIELIQAARNMHRSPLEIIILSGFDDFQYARQAISSNVLEYLLKPVSGGSLRSVLDKLDDKLAQDDLLANVQAHYTAMRRDLRANALLKRCCGLELNSQEQYSIAEQGDQGRTFRLMYVSHNGSNAREALLEPLTPPSCAAEVTPDSLLIFLTGDASSPPRIPRAQTLDPCRVALALPADFDHLPAAWARLRDLDETACGIGAGTVREQARNEALLAELAQAIASRQREEIVSLSCRLRYAMMEGAATLRDVREVILAQLSALADRNMLVVFESSHGALTEKLKQECGAAQTPEALCDLAARYASAEHPDVPAEDFGQSVMRYIDLHFGQQCSLRDISEAFHYTPSHFSRLFTERFQTSYTRYLAEFRLGKACQLLRETDEPVQEIASRVGIPDVGYFIRQFTGRFSVSPGKYRRMGE